MTAEIHHIDEALPHTSGEAKCTSCGATWIAVCPVGADWMECSDCGLHKARFVYPVVRGVVMFACHCGCDVFHIAPAGPYCTNCGDWATGWDDRPLRPAS